MKNSYAEEKPKISDIQRLMDIANNRKDNGVAQPIGLPESAQEIAKSWINFCEPRMQHEIDCQQLSNYPYQDRIADCLVIFYKLRHKDQSYLMALRAKGIYWRGDDIKFMRIREKVDMNKIDKSKLFSMMKQVIKNKPKQTEAS